MLDELDNLRILTIQNYTDIENAHNIIIQNAIGDYVAFYDPNEQSLKDLKEALNLAHQHDVLIGKRTRKIQGIVEQITSSIFYIFLKIFTNIKIDSYYSDMIICSRKVVNYITKNNDKIKFIKLSILNTGFEISEYLYTPIGKKTHKRGFLANINFAIDLIVGGSSRLIRTASIAAFGMAAFNFIYIFYIFIIYAFKDNVAQGWASSNLYNTIVYFVGFVVLGIVCEYIRMILLNQKPQQEYEIIDEKNSTALFVKDKNVEQISKENI